MRVLGTLFAFLCLIGAASAAPAFPALSGRVVDDAHLLSEPTRAYLVTELDALESRTSRQLVVVTVPSLNGSTISDYGYQLGRAWGIGQKKLSNGALFIIAPKERKARIEVGYGLEPILTDALSSVILQGLVLPKFRDGDFNGGIAAGTDELVEQLSTDQSTAQDRIAAAQALAQLGNDQLPPWWALAIIAFIVLIIVRICGIWSIPLLALNGLGSLSFGGGGGGGFSGGGGSFGGGGASGSW